MLGMSENKQNPEGIRILQQPGGTSNFTFKWKSPQPVTKTQREVRRFNSPQFKAREVLRTIQSAGSPRKYCVKVVNPPGGKTTLKIS